MKVLIGICGLGLGHSLRQKVIIDYLLEKGVQLCLIVDKQSYDFYNKFYPNITLIKAPIPFIACNEEGIDYSASVSEIHGVDYFKIELETYSQIESRFGIPDLVISDYELYSAKYSYIHSIKLINLQQQSKYIGYKTEKLPGCSRHEEVSRLRYFFPKADMTLSASFFKIDSEAVPGTDVSIIGPVIDKDLIKKRDSIRHNMDKVLVYFSNFSLVTDFVDKVEYIIKNSSSSFSLFCNSDYIRQRLSFPNVTMYEYSRTEFMEEFASSKFVISNAGHQFMSEAIMLEKPMFVYPFYTYDQHYCAYIVEKMKLGINMQDRSSDEILTSLSSVEKLRSNIQNYLIDTDYLSQVNNVLEIIEKELIDE